MLCRLTRDAVAVYLCHRTSQEKRLQTTDRVCHINNRKKRIAYGNFAVFQENGVQYSNTVTVGIESKKIFLVLVVNKCARKEVVVGTTLVVCANFINP